MPHYKNCAEQFPQGEVGEYFDAREDLAIYSASKQ